MFCEDFDMLKNNIIYFDNGATTLKPNILSKSINDYYNNYCSNIHRGSYDISTYAEAKYENTRNLVCEFINANRREEIIFTSGATDSLNKIIFGYFKNHLNINDEVILSKSEHASNILPWFELADLIGIKIKYVELTNDYKVTLDNIKKCINKNTKVISLAHVTNVIGDIRPIKKICEYAHKLNIKVLIDAAQSVPHMKIDVKDLDCDFLAFSAHKMCGPTGVGIIYGKYSLLKNTKPIIFGGGMNNNFSDNLDKSYNDIPYCFEAGTPNIADVIGFGNSIEYLNNIGMDNIEKYELELRNYLIDKLKLNKNIIIYNENQDTGIVTINYKNIFAEDLAIYLNKYNICVRSGNHCAKMLKNEIGIKDTCRISLYFYNTKKEIDILISALNNDNILNELI